MLRDSQEFGVEQWRNFEKDLEEEQFMLHQTVVNTKKAQLQLQFEKLAKQRAFLRREKRKIVLQNALLESEQERYLASLNSDWFCASAFPKPSDRRVMLDVGGRMFELSGKLAVKDPNSLLAALVQEESPLLAKDRGIFRVDRDWWLFRYMLQFLRDGLLPRDTRLLRDLYNEADYWNLQSLQKAIEQRDLQNVALAKPPESSKGPALKQVVTDVIATKEGKRLWWMEPPPWWGSADRRKEDVQVRDSCHVSSGSGGYASSSSLDPKRRREYEEREKAASRDAWWETSVYKGKDFSKILHNHQNDDRRDHRDRDRDRHDSRYDHHDHHEHHEYRNYGDHHDHHGHRDQFGRSTQDHYDHHEPRYHDRDRDHRYDDRVQHSTSRDHDSHRRSHHYDSADNHRTPDHDVDRDRDRHRDREQHSSHEDHHSRHGGHESHTGGHHEYSQRGHNALPDDYGFTNSRREQEDRHKDSKKTHILSSTWSSFYHH